MLPDSRKHLSVLRSEWEQCTNCDLGVARKDRGGPLIMGEGASRAIMFIGDGPTTEDSDSGTPLSGESGTVFRLLLRHYGIVNYYVTYTVACRSFQLRYDRDGTQKFWNRRGVKIPIEDDKPPKPEQVDACADRLHQEIYIVDPILIVTLGPEATEAVLGRKVNAMTDPGKMKAPTADEKGTTVSIPGGTYVANITPTGKWRRKIRGNVVMPTDQSQVTYPVIPLVSPYVARSSKDMTAGGVRDCLNRGLNSVKNYINEYNRLVYGEYADTSAVDIHAMGQMLDSE